MLDKRDAAALGAISAETNAVRREILIRASLSLPREPASTLLFGQTYKT